MALRASKEGHDVVVENVADRRSQSSTNKGDLATLTKRMLHGCREFAQFDDLRAMDLVEGDEHSGLVLGEEIGEQLELGTRAGLDDVRLNRPPLRRARIQRGREAGQDTPSV